MDRFCGQARQAAAAIARSGAGRRKIDAALWFPAGIKQALTDWRAGFPITAIDDKEVTIIQGTAAGRSRIKLFFDNETGLLVRQLRYSDTPVGTVPIQVDYSDYREVAGVKLPFHSIVTWTNGQTIIELSDVQPNVAIAAARFGKPAPAVVTPVKSGPRSCRPRSGAARAHRCAHRKTSGGRHESGPSGFPS